MDVKRETSAQLERLKQLMGYYPMHLEGHSTMDEAVYPGLCEVVRERGMHYMPFTGEPQPG